LTLSTAAGLLLGLAAAQGGDLQGVDPRTGKPAKPVPLPIAKKLPVKVAPEATCSGDYGTSIEFEETPKEAATRAIKEEKLVFVLHISGNFEDPRFT
jgi:hypothetical protein